MRKILFACLVVVAMAGFARGDDEIDNTFEKVDEHLYGIDHGRHRSEPPPPAPEPMIEEAPPQAAPPPTRSIQASGYLGCFKDESRRDLKEKSWSNGKMTPDKCINFCRDEGFQFAGVQYGSQCFCGNRYGKYGPLPENKCKKACSGDTDLDCGGTWANAVYAVGTGSLQTAAPPTENFPAVAGARALGCYKDEDRRDLKEKQWDDGKMTPEKCVNYCREEGFQFAGVQYGSQCFCGNRYGKYGKIPEKNCKTACSGDSDLDCGGTWANFVYEVQGGRPAGSGMRR